MNKSINLIKYQWNTLQKGLLIMLSILLGLVLFIKILSATVDTGSTHVSFGSIDFILGIYVFVFFIANFKTSFNHLINNGITRKDYFFSTIIFSIFSTLVLLVSAIVMSLICKLFNVDTSFFYNMLYNDSSIVEGYIILASILFLASMLGWLIGVLSYRYGTPMILAIIFVPQILITIFGIIISKLNLTEEFLNFTTFYLGLKDSPSPLLASLNFTITAALISLITWIFMKKVPVKA